MLLLFFSIAEQKYCCQSLVQYPLPLLIYYMYPYAIILFHVEMIVVVVMSKSLDNHVNLTLLL